MPKNLLTDQVCCICKKQATDWEPRFNYFTCKEHNKLPPVEISRLINLQ